MDSLEQYARLLVEVGINLQKGQTLVIASPLETADLARAAQVQAYRLGAREIIIRWVDELSAHTTFLMADDAIFDE